MLFSKRMKVWYILLAFAGLLIVGFGIFFFSKNQTTRHTSALSAEKQNSSKPTSIPTATFSPTLSPTFLPTPKPSASATSQPVSSKIIFGIGSQAGPAMNFRIVHDAPVHMLTSWYNGPKDLEWMRVQQNDLIPRLYKNKYIVHLITWTDLPETEIQTPYGPACGRAYPVSASVIEDMKQLAQIYNGSGPMYVSLFTEFQTYTCTDNNWIGNENYFNTLKDNFRKIKDLFHQYAPNSKVALSWGGWQSGYDDQVHQGGRSLFAHFADVLQESDYTDFQAMESDSNINEMISMTKILGSYKKPVMLSHYKPANNSQQVFDQDMKSFFTDKIINQLTANGLFAFSFMDNDLVEGSPSYEVLKDGITKYGK